MLLKCCRKIFSLHSRETQIVLDLMCSSQFSTQFFAAKQQHFLVPDRSRNRCRKACRASPDHSNIVTFHKDILYVFFYFIKYYFIT